MRVGEACVDADSDITVCDSSCFQALAQTSCGRVWNIDNKGPITWNQSVEYLEIAYTHHMPVKARSDMSLLVYRLVHAPVTRESGVRLPARERSNSDIQFF